MNERQSPPEPFTDLASYLECRIPEDDQAGGVGKGRGGDAWASRIGFPHHH